MLKLCGKYGGECVSCRDCDEDAEYSVACDICGYPIAPGEFYYDISQAVCCDCIEDFIRYA